MAGALAPQVPPRPHLPPSAYSPRATVLQLKLCRLVAATRSERSLESLQRLPGPAGRPPLYPSAPTPGCSLLWLWPHHRLAAGHIGQAQSCPRAFALAMPSVQNTVPQLATRLAPLPPRHPSCRRPTLPCPPKAQASPSFCPGAFAFLSGGCAVRPAGWTPPGGRTPRQPRAHTACPDEGLVGGAPALGKGSGEQAFPASRPPSCSLLQTGEGGGPGGAGGMNGSRGGGGPGGEGARCQRKQPSAPRPRVNPQKFPSASAALGARAATGRPLGRVNSSPRPVGPQPARRAAILWTRVRGAPGPEACASRGRPLGAERGLAAVDLPASTCRPTPGAEACTRPPRPGPPRLPPGSQPRAPGSADPQAEAAPSGPAASSGACSGQRPGARAWARCPFPAGPLPWRAGSSLPLGWDGYFWW